MSDIETNVPETDFGNQEKQPLSHLLTLGLQWVLMSVLMIGVMVTLVLFLVNIVDIYFFEVAALNTIVLGSFPEANIGAAAILAAIPWVAICVVATVITVGAVVITVMGNDPLGWLSKEIDRLKAQCPLFGPSTLGWGAWFECRARLSALRTAYWGLVLAIGITIINVIVIVGLLGRGLPTPPVPPMPPF